jgi:hypothetical protein
MQVYKKKKKNLKELIFVSDEELCDNPTCANGVTYHS